MYDDPETPFDWADLAVLGMWLIVGAAAVVFVISLLAIFG